MEGSGEVSSRAETEAVFVGKAGTIITGSREENECKGPVTCSKYETIVTSAKAESKVSQAGIDVKAVFVYEECGCYRLRFKEYIIDRCPVGTEATIIELDGAMN